MLAEIATSAGIFIAGLVLGSILYWFLSRQSYGFDVDVVKLALWLSISSILLVAAALYILNASGNVTGYYTCLFVAGVAFYLPLVLFICVSLLWWNPHKYKEYGAKKVRKERLKKESSGGLKND